MAKLPRKSGRLARRLLVWAVWLGAWLGSCPAAGPGTVVVVRPERRPPDFRTARARLADCGALPLRGPSVTIHKARHVLELYDQGRLLRTYPVALGLSPLGPKRRQGDYKTPEGHFYICSRFSKSNFHLFLGLSYPDEAAADFGLSQGLITADQHARILAAARRNACPPWNTALGGIVGIHGGGTGKDWTFGCVAVSNEAVEELWLACPLGTPVRILP